MKKKIIFLKKAVSLLIVLSMVLSALVTFSFASEFTAVSPSSLKSGYSIIPYGDVSDTGYQDVQTVDLEGNIVKVETPKRAAVQLRAGADIESSGEIPAYYDSRNVQNSAGASIITGIKDQGTSASCWAFAATAAAETSILRKTNLATVDFSESHLTYFGNMSRVLNPNDTTYGDGYNCTYPYDVGGNHFVSGGTYARWAGAEYEQYAQGFWTDNYRSATYDDNRRYISEAHMTEMLKIDDDNINAIKSAIMEYGGLMMSYYSTNNYKVTADNRVTYYQNQYTSTNHAVYVIGWSDAIPASSFKIAPPGNGAWLIKNSWGSDWGPDAGYFWLSYYDPSISNVYAMDFETIESVDNIYQYDGYWGNGISYFYLPTSANPKTLSYANVFEAQGDEILTRVSYYAMNTYANITASVYLNVPGDAVTSGTLVSTKQQTITNSGYHTINLDTPVALSEGQRFSVVITVTSLNSEPAYFVEESNNSSVCSAGENQSYYCFNGIWYEESFNVIIKAFTEDVTVDKTALQTLYDNVESYASNYIEYQDAANVLADPNATTGRVRNAYQRLKSLNEALLCTISFDGVLAASDIPASLQCIAGSVELPRNMPTYPGWAFIGWNTSGRGTDPYYTPGQTITVNNDITLKGIWAHSSENGLYGVNGNYAVYYSPNGGTWGSTDTTYKRISNNYGLLRYGMNYVFPTETPTLQKDGYRMHTSEANLTTPHFYTGNGSGTTLLGGTHNNGYENECKPNGGNTFNITSNMLPYGTNVILYAAWDPVITYNMNDGSGVTVQDFNYITRSNSYEVLGVGDYTRYSSSSQFNQARTPDSLNTLLSNREGYTGPTQIPSNEQYFIEWNTEPDGSGTSYIPGTSYDVTEPLNLYAIWSSVIYTISYNANGGTGAPSPQAKAQDVTLTLSSTIPVRDGYTFLGWATTSTATTAEYTPGGSYTANASATLYAVWEPAIYTISYNANGGTGAPSSQTKTHNASLTLSSTIPTRNGYNFLGWATTSTATTAEYIPGGSYTANASATLYAVWEVITYTVSYNANGGTGAPSSQTKSYDIALTLSSTIPTREGYTFIGWATTSTATSGEYNAGGSYTANASVTLYAVWQENPFPYMITFDGVLAASNIPQSVNCAAGSVELPRNMPTYPGWAFVGWNTSGQGSDPYYIPGQTITVTGNLHLKGIWSNASENGLYGVNGNYAVYYSPNGGTWGSTDTTFKRSSYNYGLLRNGLNYVFPTETSTLQKSGYRLHTSEANLTVPSFYTGNGSGTTLLGGTHNNGYENECLPNGLNKFNITSNMLPYGTNIILYAVWDPIITYNMNDGSGVTVRDFNYITRNNSYVVLGTGGYTRYSSSSIYNQSRTPDAHNNLLPNMEGYSGLTSIPSRTHYTLVEWNTSPDGSGTSYVPGTSYNVSEPITLYAIWQLKTYTINFDGVLAASNLPQSISGTAGSDIELPRNMPTYPGWGFIGWNGSGQGTNPYYTPGQTITLTGNMTLKGIWSNSSENGLYGINGNYAVYYSPNGGTWGSTDTTYKRSNYNYGLLRYGMNYVFPTETPTLQKSGYRMHTSEADLTIPWFFTGNGNGDTLFGGTNNNGYENECKPNGGNTFNITSNMLAYGTNIILYAAWDPIITYNMNDGTGTTLSDFNFITRSNSYEILGLGDYTRYSSSSQFNQARTPDALNTLLSNREGYTGLTQIPSSGGYLVEWNTAPDGSGTSYIPGTSYDVTEPLTLYAIWQEMESGSVTPVFSVDNYTITLSNMTEATYIRYAPGIYTTTSEIKNAPGCITLGGSTLTDNIDENGTYRLELATGGIYSFWVKFNDGSEFIHTVDATVMTPVASSNGLYITVSNLYGVKDYFIAKGDLATYRECKDAELCIGITSTKINGAKSYTYLVPSEGIYTICVRYEDTTRANTILKVNLDVDMPEIITNGLQVSIGNTTGIKVIRTAPGIHETAGEVKRADGNRNFTSSMIGESDPYTIQYSVEGTYTISVEYTNGLVVIQTVEVVKKTPTYEVQGNTVTFGNLYGCKTFRYAPGVWTTSSEVKYAPGMKYIHATTIAQDNYIESLTLEPGTYTFLVQYDDLSVNIITVVI